MKESENTVTELPDNFKQWVKENSSRIEQAKSLPYFLRDNAKYANPTWEPSKVTQALLPKEKTPMDIANERHASESGAATYGASNVKTPLTEEQKQRRAEIREIARNTIADKPIPIPGLGKFGTISRGTIKEWLNQPHQHVIEKNELLLDLCNVLPKAEYIDWGYDEHDPTTIAHLIRVEICEDDSWIVVREFNNGDIRIHSISDNPNIVEKVTKTKRKP